MRRVNSLLFMSVLMVACGRSQLATGGDPFEQAIDRRGDGGVGVGGDPDSGLTSRPAVPNAGGSSPMGTGGHAFNSGGNLSGTGGVEPGTGGVEPGSGGQALVAECHLELTDTCHQCRRDNCAPLLEELDSIGCGASADCVDQYCTQELCSCPQGEDCIACPVDVDICECAESCSFPDNSDGCLTHWQGYLECVQGGCSECIVLNRTLDG